MQLPGSCDARWCSEMFGFWLVADQVGDSNYSAKAVCGGDQRWQVVKGGATPYPPTRPHAPHPTQGSVEAEAWSQEVDALRTVAEVLGEAGHIQGVNRKAQLKPQTYSEEGELTEVQVIMKHGGVLTHAGRQ